MSRKGKENLVSLADRSTEEQRKIAAKGGKASGEARRKRKALKETMEILLSMPAADKRKLNKAVRMGFESAEVDNSTLLTIALLEKAMGGDIPAFKEVRSLIDEGGSDNGQLEVLLNGILGKGDGNEKPDIH